MTTLVCMSWKHNLGNQLKIARKAAHMTQRDLAKHLKVSRQMVCRYEAGSDAPAFDKLALAASILDVEFQVLDLRITLRDKSGPSGLQSVPKQLSFQFDKSHRFRNAVVKITPYRGRILITADIPA
jgi:transcriptional regulator with XRE-family HTH domain